LTVTTGKRQINNGLGKWKNIENVKMPRILFPASIRIYGSEIYGRTTISCENSCVYQRTGG
jgi:hypothetical protein